jgi:hypothetical protein
MILIGVGASVATYVFALPNGGHYFVFTGLILGGFIRMLRK